MPTFAQVTDLHLRPPGVLALDRVDTDAMTSAAIDRVIARHGALIDAVLVTGDVADLGEEDAYSRATMLLSRFSVPVIVVPGNHDRTTELAAAFAAFPGFADPPVAGRACHAHEIGGVTVVALDTSHEDARYGEHGGSLGAAQLDWLDATLAAAGPAFVAMHHPPFRTGIGFMDAINLEDEAKFAEIIANHDHVLRIVAGHVHRTMVAAVGGAPAVAVPGVAHQVDLALGPDTGPAIVMEPPAYAIHLVDRGGTVSHVGYVDPFGGPIRPTG